VLRLRVWIALLLLVAPMLLHGRGFAQSAPARINAIAASGRLDDLRWPNFANDRSQVINFYRPFAYQPAWIRDGQPTAQALALVQVLEDADQEGLSAEDYDASRWPGRIAALRGSHGDGDEARFDAGLTVCIMRYLSDLHVGRINPQHLGFDFDVSQKKLNLAQFIRQRLVNGSDLRTEVAGSRLPSRAISGCAMLSSITWNWRRRATEKKCRTLRTSLLADSTRE
jgi:murein L,D-transpeptidase YcbB/YkuD